MKLNYEEKTINGTEAWIKVRMAINHLGKVHAVEAMKSFDPKTRKLLMMFGGFSPLCSFSNMALERARRDFTRAYDSNTIRISIDPPTTLPNPNSPPMESYLN